MASDKNIFSSLVTVSRNKFNSHHTTRRCYCPWAAQAQKGREWMKKRYFNLFNPNNWNGNPTFDATSLLSTTNVSTVWHLISLTDFVPLNSKSTDSVRGGWGRSPFITAIHQTSLIYWNNLAFMALSVASREWRATRLALILSTCKLALNDIEVDLSNARSSNYFTIDHEVRVRYTLYDTCSLLFYAF